jgi:DNA-binding response OmpR family regulator
VIILDIMLPGMNGMDLLYCLHWRSITKR